MSQTVRDIGPAEPPPPRTGLAPPEGRPVPDAPARWWGRYGPPLLLLMCGPAVLALVAFDVPAEIRAAPVLAYVVVVPGLAGVRLLGLADRMMEILLGIGLSLALGVIVAQLMIYMDVWSPFGGLATLVVLASLALVPKLVPRRAPRPARAGDES